MDRSLKRKVDLNRRLRHSHPYDVLRAMRRLKILEIMKTDLMGSDPDRYFSPEEIAAAMFSNWSAMTDYQRNYVILAKVRWPVACLLHLHRIEEQTKKKSCKYDSYRFEDLFEGTGVYRVRPMLFTRSTIPKEWAYDMEVDSIQDGWDKWNGRQTRREQVDKFLKAYKEEV